MANPMLQAIRNQSSVAPIKNMMNMVRMASNPQAALMQIVQSNPQVKDVMDYIQQSGGDPQRAFYAKAKEMGVNPEDVLNELRNM